MRKLTPLTRRRLDPRRRGATAWILVLLLLLAAATPLGAEITFVGAATNISGSDTTAISIGTPAATQVGDLLLAFVSTDGNTSGTMAASVLADWTLIDAGACGSSACSLGAWWRIATAGDAGGAGSHGFTWTGSEQVAASIVAYRGTDPTTPIDTVAAGSGTSTSPTAPTATPTVTDSRLVRAVAVDDDDTIVNIGGAARVGSLESSSSTTSTTLGVMDEAKTDATASGTRGWLNALGFASEEWRGLTVTLAPDPDAAETCVFLEDFGRADADAIGNSWSEDEDGADDVAITVGLARLRDDNEPEDSAIYRTVDLSTIVNARATFEWASFELLGLTDSELGGIVGADDYFRVRYSLDAGATWTTFYETDLGSDGPVFRAAVPFPTAAQGQSLLLRFEADLNLVPTNEQVLLHSVRVCGVDPAVVRVEKQTLPGGDPTDFDFTFETDGAIEFVGSASAVKSADGDPQELSIPVDPGVQPDDLLVAFVVLDDDVTTLAAEAGWTPILGSPLFSTANDDFTLGAWYRIAGASEPASYVFDWDEADDEQAVGAILVYRGVDISAPLDAAAVSSLGDLGVPAVAPAVTTTAANATVVRLLGFEDTRIVSHPGASLSRADVSSSLLGVTGVIGEELLPEPGSTGVASFDYLLATEWAGFTIALRPAPVTTTFQLADGENQEFEVLPQGSHAAREASPLPAGWSFDGAACDGGATDNGAEQASILTASGETNTCVFENSVTGAPTLAKAFLDDPALPGGTVTLQFTIDNATVADAHSITFTDDLAAMLPGASAVGLPQNDVCGVGSTISGTTLLTLTGGAVPAGSSCVFSVTVQMPDEAPAGSHANVTSSITSTFGADPDDLVAGAAAASDALEVEALPVVMIPTLGETAMGILAAGLLGAGLRALRRRRQPRA